MRKDSNLANMLTTNAPRSYGGWLTARFAPSAPTHHASVLAAIGFVLGALSAVAAITKYDLGPNWYPIAIVLLSVPAIWMGATWYCARNPNR
jgi:hypothetical protein